MTQVWFAKGATTSIDRRSMLRRNGTLVHQNVRVWRGVVTSTREGKQVFDHCPHAHNKQGAAAKCADAAAKRLNRALAKGETWPLEVGK